MYTRMPYHNTDLQAMGSSMWSTVPMAPQEPNLNVLLMMIQMLSHMKKFQYQPISAPNQQQPAEIDIQSMFLRAEQRNFVMDELVKSQVQREETRENEVHEGLPFEVLEMQQRIQRAAQKSEEKDVLIKTTEELEVMAAENEKIKKELQITKEKLENCGKAKEEEIKCNSIDNLHQVAVLGPIAGWHSAALRQGFRPGSKIVIRGRADKAAARLSFNFKDAESTVLHVDNRWNYLDSDEKVVMNTYTKESWGEEEIMTPAPIAPGSDFVFSVQCEKEEYKICVNGSPFATYSHRVDPRLITVLDISGAAEITSVHYQGHEQESDVDSDRSFTGSDDILLEGSDVDSDRSLTDSDDVEGFLGYYLGVR